MADLQSEKLTIIKIANGAPGTPGTSGSNYATVYLYRRFASTPSSSDKPTGNVTYTFSSGAVSGSLNNWQRTVPTGTNPCYMILAQATAPAGTATDTIAKSEWSTPVEVFKNGSPGADAYNQATIYLYKRSATPLTNQDEPSELVYTFSSGTLTGDLNGWSRSVPTSDGNPCYVISAVPVSQDSSITISDWANPTKLVEDGTSITVVSTQYQEGTSYDTEPTGQWSNTPVQVTPGNYLWTKITYSDGSFSYAVSRQGEDGEDANQYTIHTNVEEILKFVKVNESTENLKKYEFSLETLQMNVYDIKNQLNILNTYTTLDIEIEGFKFIDIIDPTHYNTYIEKKQGDNINFFFNIGILYNKLLNGTLIQDLKEPEQEQPDRRGDFISSLQQFFTNLGVSDIIVYGNIQLDNKTFNIEKYVSLKNGLSNEMLNFSINAGSINAAIQNSKLNFNADGLTITNGGFKIKTNNETVFYIDPITNQLCMNGTGTFTGDIYANNGRFNGEINATTGIIGGFSIGENSIESDNLILTSSHESIESSIYVKNIKIGNGAEVIGSISIGNLKLLKPSNNNDNVLVLTDNDINYFSLKNNGDIEGNGWFIKKENNETVACFDNGIFKGTIEATNGYFEGEITASVINASTINTVNFITEKIRSMGGAFIFKPSFEINSFEINGSYIYVTFNNDKDYNTFRINDIVGFTTDEDGKGIIIGQVRAITPPSGENWKNYTIKVQTYSQPNNDLTTITWFGKADEDIIIGINSDNQSAGSLLPQKSLTIQDFTFDNNILIPSIKLLLGDLSPVSGIIGDNPGYGLYADNVYLTGSLTTEQTNDDNNKIYAGISTRTQALKNNERIMFWAGAKNDGDITNSPFIVTEKGSIYASKGEFANGIISNSTIKGGTIEAATIVGTGKSPSLKIYNTDKDIGGIGFYQKGNPDVLTLLINSEGLNYNNNLKIIDFNNNNVIFNGSEFIANQMKLSPTQLSNNGSKIEFNDETIKINYNTNAGVEISSGQVRNFGGKVINEGSMILKDTTVTPAKLEYVVKNNYYCLMVTKGQS